MAAVQEQLAWTDYNMTLQLLFSESSVPSDTCHVERGGERSLSAVLS